MLEYNSRYNNIYQNVTICSKAVSKYNLKVKLVYEKYTHDKRGGLAREQISNYYSKTPKVALTQHLK